MQVFLSDATRRKSLDWTHLDEENRKLQAAEEMGAVIDHDLQEDTRVAFFAILRFHGFLPESEDGTASSRVIVVTPFNI